MSDRDWTEDADHENGQYQCQCLTCGNMFVGHKRRVVCHTCAYPRQYPLLHHAAQLARQLEAAGCGEGRWDYNAEGCDLDDDSGEIRFEWLYEEDCGENVVDDVIASIRVAPDGSAEASVESAAGDVYGQYRFRVGDPLPAALIQAIRETA